MRANAMRAARSVITWSSGSARTPRRQAAPRAERQHQIRIRLAVFYLTPGRRLSPRPADTRTAGVARLHREGSSIKAIAKHIGHIIPDSVSVEVIAEDCLADVGLENAVLNWCDL